jgi:hypothetical protein
MHQNNFFYFIKIIFNINILKKIKNIIIFILNKKIIFKIFNNTVWTPHSQSLPINKQWTLTEEEVARKALSDLKSSI